LTEGKKICGIYVDQNVERAEEAERELEAWAFRDYEEMMQTKIEDNEGPLWVPSAPSHSAADFGTVDAFTMNEETDFIAEMEQDRRAR